MANGNDWYKAVAGHQRVSHLDGHEVNESYKIPSANPSQQNLSYMHPHLKPLGIGGAFKTADKALGEAHRPAGQIGKSKTVFAVNDQKARGVPRAAPKAAPGIIPGPVKPTLF